MGEESKAFINEIQIDVSQKRVTKLIEAKTIIKEVIHYDPIEKSKHKTIVNMIDEVIADELKVQENPLGYDNRLSIDEAVNHLADTFIQMKDIMDSVAIEDSWYSKAFWDELENALITMAVIKAFGISKKSERYLGAVKKVVREQEDI